MRREEAEDPVEDRRDEGQAVRRGPFRDVNRKAGAVAVDDRGENQQRRARDQGRNQPLFEMIERAMICFNTRSPPETAGSAFTPGQFL